MLKAVVRTLDFTPVLYEKNIVEMAWTQGRSRHMLDAWQ
jgi:hypothetical protein